MNIIQKYNSKHGLDDIVNSMLNQTYLNNPKDPTIFMANHLLQLSSTSVQEFSEKTRKKLNTECKIYADEIEDYRKKLLELERKIEERVEALKTPCKTTQESVHSPPKLDQLVQSDIDSPSNAMSSQDSGEMKHYDFVPADVCRMYKERNKEAAQKKKNSEFFVTVYPTLSAPAASGLQVTIKKEKD